ncbi:MAG: glutamate synthase-related protein [Desulfotignum sp.]
MGADRPYPIYWDHILFNAAQVTNPSIGPLREPMEIKTYIGSKADKLQLTSGNLKKAGGIRVKQKISPQLELSTPILFSAMSFGSISFNACRSLAQAASQFGTFYNTGEGGLHRDLEQFAGNTIVQVASGRFGVDIDYLSKAAAVEIKIGQGAKPGIGGHLPGEKVTEEVSNTRMIPRGTDAISPAPHHDIYSIEDLSQLIFALKEATDYQKPVGVKVSAVHNVAPIASGIVRAGADFVTIDGLRGGTGAAPLAIRDNIGIPIELALASVDTRLREEKIRHRASIIAAGSLRSSSDIIKAIALGADAVYIGTAALVAMGCHLCQKMLFAGAMSMGFCLWQTGAAEWLAINWLSFFADAHWFVFVMAISFFVMLMTNFIMNVAAIAISVPVALVVAPYLGVAAEVIVFSALVVAGMPFLLLVGAAPNAIAYNSGQFTSGEFFGYGIPASILLMALVALAVLLIWPLLGMPILLS